MKQWRVPYPKFGAGVGLDRIARIAAKLDLDLAQFGARSAVITGSNGKGSTAAMAASILQQADASVGLFTSPHLLDLNERFHLDGEDIADDELGFHWDRVAGAARAADEQADLGGFEFLFLIAVNWFAARKADCIVWEAGIGGRNDPTRLVQAQRTALTSLDYEHTELLGETLQEIAHDKLDAAPEGATVFISEGCLSQRAAIVSHCAERNLTPVFVAADEKYPTSLAGAFQQQNAALAVAVARDMVELRDEAIVRGLAATRWPGRLETLSTAPLIVIDVGHTPAGVRAALEGFRALRAERSALLVTGVSADKDAAKITGALAPDFAQIVCVAAHHKGRAAAEIAALAAEANAGAEIAVAENVIEARRLALAKAAPDTAIYVAGGFFLAAEFKAAHLGRDPASLAFF